MNGRRHLTTVLVLVTAMLGGWLLSLISHWAELPVAHETRKANVTRTSLGLVRSPQGVTRLWVFQLPHSDCIVHEPARKVVTFEDESNDYFGDPDSPDDDLMPCLDPGERWRVSPNDPSDLSTFNCATFAIGETIGLTKTQWLEPIAVEWTRGRSSARVVLDNFYDLILTVPLEDGCWQSIESSPLVQHDDVIAFVSNQHADGFVHLGKIRKDSDSVVMVSKLGSGPIVEGSIRSSALRFRGEILETRIYRLRPESN